MYIQGLNILYLWEARVFHLQHELLPVFTLKKTIYLKSHIKENNICLNCCIDRLLSKELDTPKYQAVMRAPSLLAQCLPGLAPQDRGAHSISTISDRDVHLSSPAVEILPSRV